MRILVVEDEARLAQTLADMEADGTTERIAASFGLGADTALGRTTP